MPHTINVNKENEDAVRDLLDNNNIPFTIWDEHPAYSVISTDEIIPSDVAVSILDLSVKSGTHFDREKIAWTSFEQSIVDTLQ